jgi:predicted HicB family RNase H-like nuclease
MSPRRRRGRPPEDGTKGENVTIRLSPALQDHVCREALRRGTSVSAIVRRALRRMLSDRLSA